VSNERQHRTRRVPLDIDALSGHVEIFRIDRSLENDSAVADWLHADEGELRSIAKQWFMEIRRCGDDVRETLHDGCPVACVGDAPFAYVNVFKNHVNVGFFYGAFLEDPARLLEGSGKRMRHVTVKRERQLDSPALTQLIRAAYLDLKARDPKAL